MARPLDSRPVWVGMKGYVTRNFLPVSFAVAFVLALSWPWLGRQVAKPEVADVRVVTFINICIVFFISGLNLRTTELKDALSKQAMLGTMFAMTSILGLTPLLGFVTRELPLHPAAFAAGLTVFCVVPTTLGVGVSLVMSAKGNVALALFLTVATNLLGIVLIPVWLKAMLSGSSFGVSGLSLEFLPIFVRLLLSVLVPSVLGKALRELSPAAADFQRKHKAKLTMFSNAMLAMINWQTLSNARDTIVDAKFGDMLLMILCTALIHVVYLLFNALAAFLLRIPLPEAIAVVIMASQKSAPVGITAIMYVTTDPQLQGLLTVPCIIGQLVQIFLGQPIANALATVVTKREAEQEEALLPAAETPP